MNYRSCHKYLCLCNPWEDYRPAGACSLTRSRDIQESTYEEVSVNIGLHTRSLTALPSLSLLVIHSRPSACIRIRYCSDWTVSVIDWSYPASPSCYTQVEEHTRERWSGLVSVCLWQYRWTAGAPRLTSAPHPAIPWTSLTPTAGPWNVLSNDVTNGGVMAMAALWCCGRSRNRIRLSSPLSVGYTRMRQYSSVRHEFARRTLWVTSVRRQLVKTL